MSALATTQTQPNPAPDSARAVESQRRSGSFTITRMKVRRTGTNRRMAPTRHNWKSAGNDRPNTSWRRASSHIMGFMNVAGLGSGVIALLMNKASREAVTQDQYCAWSGTSNIRPV